jgi:hypothetical protein
MEKKRKGWPGLRESRVDPSALWEEQNEKEGHFVPVTFAVSKTSAVNNALVMV